MRKFCSIIQIQAFSPTSPFLVSSSSCAMKPMLLITGVEISLRFAFIFLRSPVIPLIPPLIFAELLLRIEVDHHYFWTENRYSRWYPAIKTPVYVFVFDADAEKSVPNRKTRFLKRKTKNVGLFFCAKMETILYRNLSLEKSVKKWQNPVC